MKKKGFTLVEMMVVIVIIGVLMSLVVAWVGKAGHDARYAATKALVDTLSHGCDRYRVEMGQYPPMTYGGADSSRNLHLHLGGPRTLYLDGQTRTLPPVLEFRRNWLGSGSPALVVDAWERPLSYADGGTGVDIRSQGRSTADPTDDVGNTIRDY